MKRRLKEPFGKAGLTIAVLALVLALVGGAYAAGALSGKQKKEVEKIAKKYAGKPGAPGANGAEGKAGPEGPSGANGKNGANGKSVTLGAAPSGPGEECEDGGATVEVEGNAGTKKYVCDGEEGSPWTAGGTLPSEQTETGTWAVSSESGKTVVTEEEVTVEGPIDVGVSFPIPLPLALSASQVHYLKLGETIAGVCAGTVAAPAAAKGNLCVYESGGNNLKPAGEEPPFQTISKPSENIAAGGADPSGAILTFFAEGAPPRYRFGTWAVTAE